MNPQRLIGLLLLVAAVILAAPRPSAGQFVFTLRQYVILQERMEAFCSYYAEQTNGGRPAPKGDLAIPGFGNNKYVFRASEVEALKIRCDRLLPLMRELK